MENAERSSGCACTSAEDRRPSLLVSTLPKSIEAEAPPWPSAGEAAAPPAGGEAFWAETIPAANRRASDPVIARFMVYSSHEKLSTTHIACALQAAASGAPPTSRGDFPTSVFPDVCRGRQEYFQHGAARIPALLRPLNQGSAALTLMRSRIMLVTAAITATTAATRNSSGAAATPIQWKPAATLTAPAV